MGQDFIIVNITKKEYYRCRGCNKYRNTTTGMPAMVMAQLMLNEWKNDHIQIQGDYDKDHPYNWWHKSEQFKQLDCKEYEEIARVEMDTYQLFLDTHDDSLPKKIKEDLKVWQLARKV